MKQGNVGLIINNDKFTVISMKGPALSNRLTSWWVTRQPFTGWCSKCHQCHRITGLLALLEWGPLMLCRPPDILASVLLQQWQAKLFTVYTHWLWFSSTTSSRIIRYTVNKNSQNISIQRWCQSFHSVSDSPWWLQISVLIIEGSVVEN